MMNRNGMAMAAENMFNVDRQHDYIEQVQSLEQRLTGFGVDVANTTSADTLMRDAGLDWTVSKRQVYLADGRALNSRAVVRDLDDKILCESVSPDYTPFQQEQFKPLVDQLLQLGAQAKRAGSFYGGQKVWMQFELPQRLILGDAHKHYVYLVNSHDATGGVNIFTSLVRTACSNGLNMAFKGASAKLRFVHRGKMDEKIDTAISYLNAADAYAKSYADLAANLALEEITRSDVADFVNYIFPMPLPKDGEMLTDRQKDTVFASRERAYDMYDHKEDLCEFGDTKLKLLQLGADLASHPIYKREGARTNENYVANSIFGVPEILRRSAKFLEI